MTYLDAEHAFCVCSVGDTNVPCFLSVFLVDIHGGVCAVVFIYITKM